jgi:hypothetical protein
MKNLNIFLKIYVICAVVLIGFCAFVSIAIHIPTIIEIISDFKYVRFFQPERMPSRNLSSTDQFTFLWSKKIEDGSRHLTYTQLFTPDDKNLIYITTHSLNSIDYLTGDLLWSTEFPEDTIFHFYDGRLYSLDSACEDNRSCTEKVFDIPPMCNVNLSHLNRLSAMRVYDAHTGNKLWEYSYRMIYPNEIFFNGNSMILEGMTWDLLRKYILNIEVSLDSGEVIKSDCANYNSYSRISDNDGILSSAFSPILSDDDWKDDSDKLAFTTRGSSLILANRQTKQPLGKITFTGFSLDPWDIQLIIHNDLLVVYFDDSNQFFTFRMK